MHGLVINISRDRLNAIAVRLTVSLLLIGDKVLVMYRQYKSSLIFLFRVVSITHLRASDDPLRLHTLHGFVREAPTEIRVCRKALPIPASGSDAPKGSYDGSERNVHPFHSELEAHTFGATSSQGLVPAGADMDPARETTDEIRRADALSGVRKTQAGEVETRYGGDISRAGI